MARLRTMGNRVAMAPSRQPAAHRSADNRMTGRALQRRRLNVWSQAGGLCAECKALTSYPSGFELDHVVPLFQGGADTEANCQPLCPECHARKTARDLGRASAGGASTDRSDVNANDSQHRPRS